MKKENQMGKRKGEKEQGNKGEKKRKMGSKEK